MARRKASQEKQLFVFITVLLGLYSVFMADMSTIADIQRLFLLPNAVSLLMQIIGGAIAQEVSRWLPTAAAWVQTRVWSRGFL
jgi:multisubunit Na+/H+ antiporter MnhC subunit